MLLLWTYGWIAVLYSIYNIKLIKIGYTGLQKNKIIKWLGLHQLHGWCSFDVLGLFNLPDAERPTHLGMAASQMEHRGVVTERGNMMRDEFREVEIIKRNMEQVMQEAVCPVCFSLFLTRLRSIIIST